MLPVARHPLSPTLDHERSSSTRPTTAATTATKPIAISPTRSSVISDRPSSSTNSSSDTASPSGSSLRAPLFPPTQDDDDDSSPRSSAATSDYFSTERKRRDSTSSSTAQTRPTLSKNHDTVRPRAPQTRTRQGERNADTPPTLETVMDTSKSQTPFLLPVAPHLLAPSSPVLTSLPHPVAIAVLQSLSRAVEAAAIEAARAQREIASLVAMLQDKGLGDGEIERARVRARADPSSSKPTTTSSSTSSSTARMAEREWRIDVPASVLERPDHPWTASLPSSDRSTTITSETETDLDLDDLAEAISENAFSYASDQPSAPPVKPPAVVSSGPAPPDGRDTQRSSRVPQTRQRHASLSSRIFGSLTGSSTSSTRSLSPRPSPKLAAPASPSQNETGASASLEAQSASAEATAASSRTRAASIASVSSAKSTTSSSMTDDAARRDGGYGEWLAWRSWTGSARGRPRPRPVASTTTDKTSPPVSELERARDETGDSETLANEAATHLVSSPTADADASALTGDLEAKAAGDDLSSVDSQSSASPAPVADQSRPSSPESASRTKSHTAISPTLTRTVPSKKAAAPALSTPVPTSTLSHAPSSPGAKSSAPPDFVSATQSLEPPHLGHSPDRSPRESHATLQQHPPPRSPNVTLFPKLPSLKKASPFAEPTVSTPFTHVSLSSRPKDAAVVTTTNAAQPSSRTTMASTSSAVSASTMELDTMMGHLAPPTLTLAQPSGPGSDTAAGSDEPMVDRYGFVYDVRSGMKLLRASRRRKRDVENGERTGNHADEAEVAPRHPEAAESDTSQVDVEAELEALREALGLPASTSSSPTMPRSPAPVRTDEPADKMFGLGAPPADTSTVGDLPAASEQSRPSHLLRSASSDLTTSLTSSTGHQSMKRLLGQLTEIHDADDKAQKTAWEAFIRRRQDKLRSASTGAASESGKGGLGRRAKRISGGGGGTLTSLIGRDLGAADVDDSWTEDLVGVAQMGVTGKSGKEDWAEFKALIRKGVPLAFRAKIWAECSGANEAREPGLYQELLSRHRGETNQCLSQIDMDCHRTFPTNVFFAGSGPGVAKLRNVLVAYSWRNPAIGYCQGMNNLTATLLLCYPAEEDAFWVLVCLIEKILPSDYYTSHLLVSQADQRVLRDLVERHLPRLAAHLEDLGVELPAITFGWFLSLFTDALPIQTLLRVWDLLFVLGTVILFRVAIAVLELNETEMLACDSAATLYALMRTLTTHLYQVDRLLKIACDDLKTVVKDRDISTLRNRHVAELTQELGLSPDDDQGTEVV